MTETIYVFGAGINRSLCDPQGHRPPLATDLFQLALARPFAGYSGEPSWYSPVFDYIQRFWKLSVDDLKRRPFDLEECYTLLQLQANEAYSQGNSTEFERLFVIKSMLTSFFSQYLEISSIGADASAVDFITLGKAIWKEKATVITFNYDTLIESAIESASFYDSATGTRLSHDQWKQMAHNYESSGCLSYDKFNDIPTELMGYSRHPWDSYRAYGVRFDEVMHKGGISKILVNGQTYFDHPQNKPCQPKVLKMHGSLNWGRYVRYVQVKGHSATPPRAIQPGTTILGEGFGMIADHMFEPLIITPMLFKNLNQDTIIVQIWQQALAELKACERLIVGGYSFPPTDFYARKLFLEAFADRQPREVVVINPDSRAESLVQDLTHMKPRRFDNLDAFIREYGDHHALIDEWDEQWVRSFRRQPGGEA